MARTNNLTNYLTDIATAIKTKKGVETPINASKFDEEIANLPSGGGVDEYFAESKSNLPNGYLMHACLKKIPMIDTSKLTNFSRAFVACGLIETIPLLDTSSATDMSYMFQDCSSLKTIPELNTSNVTKMKYMFEDCRQLETIPLLDASKCNDIASMLSYCTGLINLGGFYNLGEAFSTKQNENYVSYKLDLNNCNKLTHDSLMNVINNLYDIKTIGVKTQQLILGSSLLAKLTADEIAIATNKGWSVS